MLKLLEKAEKYIDIKSPWFWFAFVHIIWNVLYWNVTSRLEYFFGFFSKFWKNKKTAVVIHGTIIFINCVSRSFIYKYVVEQGPKLMSLFQYDWITIFGYLLYSFGILLVVSSTYQLGVIGTYNGDAYGFLLPGIIKDFPFNYFNAPMYLGSTINFFAHAIIYRSLNGFLLSILVAIVYFIGTHFEDNLTKKIYSPENPNYLKLKSKK